MLQGIYHPQSVRRDVGKEDIHLDIVTEYGIIIKDPEVYFFLIVSP